MLNLITGLPGAGKTLYFLSKVLPQYRGRDVYVHGIPAIDHEHFGTRDLENPEEWYKLPEGAVTVIDEAQKIFPVRKPGSMVPEKCAAFETHRHRGHDVVLLTQDATTLDVHIRKLAGKHIHVHRLFGGQSANIFEYGNFESKPTDNNTKKTALGVRSWRYDKSVFDHYKSADLHTVKRKIPFKILMLPVLLIGALVAIFAAGLTIKNLFAGGSDEPGGPGSMYSQGPAGAQPVTRQSLLDDWKTLNTPVIEGWAWTAPMYAKATRVRTFPKPFCIQHETSPGSNRMACTCYSQQATKLPDVPIQVCKQFSEEGWFDFTREEEREARRNRAQREAPARSSLPIELQSEWPADDQ